MFKRILILSSILLILCCIICIISCDTSKNENKSETQTPISQNDNLTTIEKDTTFVRVQIGELVSYTLPEAPSQADSVKWRNPFKIASAPTPTPPKFPIPEPLPEKPKQPLNINEFRLVGITEVENEKKAIIMVNDIDNKGRTYIIGVGNIIKAARVVSVTDKGFTLQIAEDEKYKISMPENAQPDINTNDNELR